MNVQAVNMADLWETYFVRTGAPTASEILRDFRRNRIDGDSLLGLAFEPRRSPGQDRRKLGPPFLALLEFYSVLEIALLIKFIPEPAYDDLWGEIGQNLALPEFRVIYENDFGSVLPGFLSGRLEGRLHLDDEQVGDRRRETSALFLGFLDSLSRVKRPSIRLFLRDCISSPYIPVEVLEFISILGSKEEFMRRILKGPNETYERVDVLLHGFSHFLTFCFDFDSLLQDSQAFPLFQSAMWNYFGDLFQALGDRLAQRIGSAVGEFQYWVADEHWDEARPEVVRYIDGVRDVVQRLTSGSYGHSMGAAVLEPFYLTR